MIGMRREASVLHLDLDAFFAAVEQRDKPSLRGRPVVVGGVGGRGVVATASYEARAFGARSAMSTAEARRRCPPGRRSSAAGSPPTARTSDVVMALLRELSPLVEPASLDEAYVDLAAGEGHDLSVEGVTAIGHALKERIAEATGGVTGSVGIGTSKMMAKIGSDLDKPDGLVVVPPGTRARRPAPAAGDPARRGRAGDRRAAAPDRREDGRRPRGSKSLTDLVALAGRAHGAGLYALARAEDDRAVVPDREAKSVSHEETFERDLTDLAVLGREIDSMAARVGERLRTSAFSGRTVTLKLRRYDFTTLTRSQTLPSPPTTPARSPRPPAGCSPTPGTQGGLRLLGVGVSGLSVYAQGDLFAEDERTHAGARPPPTRRRPPSRRRELPVRAAVVARAGRPPRGARRRLGVGPRAGPGDRPLRGPARPRRGPVRTLAADDPLLQPADPPDWR